MTTTQQHETSPTADILLSWDRLGFRLLVFGSLAIFWILQGRLWNQGWTDLILGEVKGILPWAFLAPLVLRLDRRIRSAGRGLGFFLGAHILGMVIIFLPCWILQRVVTAAWEGWQSGFRLTALAPTWQNTLGNFLNVPFVYLIILLGNEAMNRARAQREETFRAGQLAGQLSQARLALLQRQLHPHFLFNALQAISTLLHRDPGMADALVLRLSALLRAMLEDASGQMISLGRELELTRAYLDIEQARFGERLRIQWDVDASLSEVEVPSLAVLPLVENAIRHGLSPKVGPGLLKISALAEGTALVITVSDDGLGAELPLRTGVGLGNTEARLTALYGDRAKLTIEARPNGGFSARLSLPWRKEAA